MGVEVDHPIVLFDGVCNLCNWWVQFIIKRDSRVLFRYAALQSRTGQRLIVEHGLRPQYLETLLLIDGGSAFTKSDAILGIVSYLPGMWRLLGVFYSHPSFPTEPSLRSHSQQSIQVVWQA